MSTIYFEDLQHVFNQNHLMDSQLHDGMEKDWPRIEQGGEEDKIDEGDGEGDLMDGYIPSGSGAGRGGGEEDEGEDEEDLMDKYIPSGSGAGRGRGEEDEGYDKEDLMDEYIPSGSGAGRGCGGRRGHGGGIGHGARFVQNHNWDKCNHGSGKLNLVFREVACSRSHQYISDEENIFDADDESGLVNQTGEGNLIGNPDPSPN